MPVCVDEPGHQHSALAIDYSDVLDSAGVNGGRRNPPDRVSFNQHTGRGGERGVRAIENADIEKQCCVLRCRRLLRLHGYVDSECSRYACRESQMTHRMV